ncbi:MAG: M48 family metallopeptidase [Clostridia bacterium]|nr:M48 family metallopeptidase [Clostridia bacterium]
MYKIIILCVLVLGFIYNLITEALARKQKDKPLDPRVADIYDPEKYTTWREYTAEKAHIRLIFGCFEFILMALLFAFDAFSAVYGILPGGIYTRSLLLLTGYTAVMTVISIPFDYVSSIVIEGKYGFNKSTTATFVGDTVKGFIVNLGLNCGLYCLVQSLYDALGNTFFIAAYAAIALFVVVFSMLSTFFQKLYNKFTPLEEGELRDNLTRMFAAAGYKLKDIYVMDASRRTTKVNAFCSGLGRFKKIVLYDNLVNNYTPGEITAVFAHELAHFKHRDTAKGTALSLLSMLVMTLLIAAFAIVDQISVDYGFEGASIIFGLIALMGAILGPVNTVIGIPAAVLSRSYERRADAMAVDSGYGEDMISALKKLSKDNFADLNPHPFTVAVEYSHPPIAERIDLIQRRMGARN